MRMRRIFLVLLINFLPTGIVFASSVTSDSTLVGGNRKPIWDWSTDERLAARLSAVRAVPEGRRVVAAGVDAAAPISDESSTYSISIDGRQHPELFLPHELFDGLLSGLMPDIVLREKQREYYARALQGIGLDPMTFWAELDSITTAYQAYRFGVVSGTRAEMNDWTLKQCRERHKALTAAREFFGAREFDRLLYIVVGSSMQYASSVRGPRVAIEKLRAAEGGCQ